MRERLHTLCVVSLVTVLIWLFAENKVVDEVTLPQVRVAASGYENTSIRINPPGQVVTIQMKGPTHALNEVRAALEREGGIVVRPGRDGVPAEPGVYDIPMLEFLRQNPATGGRGVSITSVDPPILKEVVVDQWVDRTLDVQPGSIAPIETDGPITVSPATVNVRLARSLAEQMDLQRLRAIALPINTERLNNLTPGEQHTVDAVLSLDPEIADFTKYELGSSSARMTFRVRVARSEISLNGVAIQLVLTPQDQSRYRIELEDVLIPQVTVSGPSDLVGRIERRELPVIGYLVLSSDELFRGITEKTISFGHLPGGLSIAPSPITARFRIVRLDGPQDASEE